MGDDGSLRSISVNSLFKENSSESSRENKKPISPVKSLIDEWHLFWEGFAPESDHKSDLNEKSPLQFQAASLPQFDQIEFVEITKRLSKERQKIHQQLEKINKEIDLISAKVESLRLVGGEESESLERISVLSDQGLFLETQLKKLDEKLKIIRNQKESFESEEAT